METSKTISKEPYLSIVIPVYNEQDNLGKLFIRLKSVLDNYNQTYEIIMVDDGSNDDSLKVMKEYQKTIPEIVIIEFNRNYGQHSAVFAGFERSTGKVVVTMDADMQTPPEEIPKLLDKINEGYDVVATIRKNRYDSFFRKIASFLMNKTAARITGVNLKDYGCMLRAYKKEIVHSMCISKEISTFIPALATIYAGSIAEIEVEHTPRKDGKTKYNLLKLISLQFDLITSFSNFPIKLLVYLGFIVSFLGIGFAVFLFLRRLILGPEVEGVFTLFAILFFFIGAQFLAFGLLGEYISRIYLEVRKRPRYIIKNIYKI